MKNRPPRSGDTVPRHVKERAKLVVAEIVRQSPGDELAGTVRLFKAFYFAHLYHAVNDRPVPCDTIPLRWHNETIAIKGRNRICAAGCRVRKRKDGRSTERYYTRVFPIVERCQPWRRIADLPGPTRQRRIRRSNLAVKPSRGASKSGMGRVSTP